MSKKLTKILTFCTLAIVIPVIIVATAICLTTAISYTVSVDSVLGTAVENEFVPDTAGVKMKINGKEASSAKVKKDSTVVLSFEATGYDISNWYAGTKDTYDANAPLTEDLTLTYSFKATGDKHFTAVFTAARYHTVKLLNINSTSMVYDSPISMKAEGSEVFEIKGKPNEFYVKDSAKFTLTFSSDEYVVDSWYKGNTITEEAKLSGDSFSVNEDSTFTAYYKPKYQYSISVITSGVDPNFTEGSVSTSFTVSGNEQNSAWKSEIVNLGAAIEGKYQFINWTLNGEEISKDKNCTFQVDGTNTNLIFSANVRKFNKYSINITVEGISGYVFNGNNGNVGTKIEVGSNAVTQAWEGDNVKLSIADPAHITDRYEFKGWKLKGNDNIISTNMEYSFTASGENLKLDYIAVVEPLTYSTQIKAVTDESAVSEGSIEIKIMNESEVAVTANTFSENATAGPAVIRGNNVSLSVITRIGYEFLGWTVGGTIAEGKQIIAGSDSGSATYAVTGDGVTFYANFKVVKFTINYNNGTTTTTAEDVRYGSNLTTIAPTYNQGWVNFTGWKFNENIVSKANFSSTSSTIDLVATYSYQSAITYTFNFSELKDGDTILSEAGGSATYNTGTENGLKYTIPPTRAYYALVGLKIEGTEYLFETPRFGDTQTGTIIKDAQSGIDAFLNLNKTQKVYTVEPIWEFKFKTKDSEGNDKWLLTLDANGSTADMVSGVLEKPVRDINIETTTIYAFFGLTSDPGKIICNYGDSRPLEISGGHIKTTTIGDLLRWFEVPDPSSVPDSSTGVTTIKVNISN